MTLLWHAQISLPIRMNATYSRYVRRFSAFVNNTDTTTPVFPSILLSFRSRVCHCRPRAQRLQLYESNATPKLYACFEKHSKPGESPTARILAPIGSSFEVAFDHFKEFFKLKTGRDWDDRLRKVEPIPSAFVFALPKTGEARGVMQNDGPLMEGRGGNPVMHSTTKEPSGSTMDHTVSLVVQSGDAIVDRFE